MRILSRIVITAAVLTLVLNPGASAQDPRLPDLSALVDGSGHHQVEAQAKRDMMRRAALEQPVLAKSWAPDRAPSPIDVQHYDLDLHLDPVHEIISGTVEVDLRAVENGLTAVELDADGSLRIHAVVLTLDASYPHDAARTLSWVQEDNRVRIALHRPLAAGEQVRLLVAYAGHGSLRGYGVGWDEQEDGTLLMTTFSQPFGARMWWPCSDRPDDKATVGLRVTAPSELTVAANGVRTGRVENADGTATTRFVSRYPIATYLVVVNVTAYVYSETTYEGLDGTTMPVGVYAYPGLADRAESSLANTPDIIAAFAERFGEYPFLEESYGNALTPFGGGMEHQTLCSYGAGVLGLEWLNAHEVAHQWWGDWVTYESWKEVWLAEGLASYSEWLWLEHQDPPQVVPYALTQDPFGFFTGALYDNPVPFSSTVYDKGAWVYSMLRHVIGDDAFFAGLGIYRSTHAAGAATSEDLRAAMEEAAETDLEWFFDQWVYGVGRPHVLYDWEEVAGPAVRIHLRQVHSNNDPYRMPIDVRVTTTAGVEQSVVWLESLTEQTVDIPVAAAPTGVELDPDTKILWDLGPASAPAVELGAEYPGPHVFPTVVQGQTARATIPVSNPGGVDLTITGLGMAIGTRFSLVSPTELPWVLAPGESGEIEVEYAPTRYGETTDWAWLISDDPARARIEGLSAFEVHGEATLASDPMVLLAPRLDFGEVPVGAAATSYFDIFNFGTDDLAFDLSLSGEDYSWASASSGVLGPNEQHRVHLYLTPSAEGERVGSVVVSSNDPLTPEHTVALTGVGVAGPRLEAAPTALSFGLVSETEELAVEIVNAGAGDLVVSAVSIDPPFILSEQWTLPVTLAAGERRPLTVRFEPTGDSRTLGTLRILSSDPDLPWTVVPLSARPLVGEVHSQAYAAVARAPGFGSTFWVSDAVIVNPTTSDADLDLGFRPDTLRSDGRPDLTLSVPAGQARPVADVVAAVGHDGVGGLEVLASAPGLVAVSRTHTGNDAGTYGQHIAAVADERALVAGSEYTLAGLAGNAGFHTNLGVLNRSDRTTTVTFTLFDVEGSLLGQVDVTAEPNAFAQTTRAITELTASEVRGGFAVVTCDDQGAIYLAYASTVDDGSHDPTFISPIPESLAPLDVLVPAVASNPGLNNTFWSSQLTIVNRGSAAADVSLRFQPRGGGEQSAATLEVAAGAALYLSDVVGETLGGEGSGWLRLSSASSELYAASRTFNDDPAGTFGQSVPAVEIAGLHGPGDMVVLPGMTSGSGFRTNLGVASMAGVDTVVQATVYTTGGAVVGELAIEVPADSLVQLDRVLADRLQYTGAAFAVLTSADPGARYTAYVSVVDEGTGDPAFVPGVAAAAR